MAAGCLEQYISAWRGLACRATSAPNLKCETDRNYNVSLHVKEEESAAAASKGTEGGQQVQTASVKKIGKSKQKIGGQDHMFFSVKSTTLCFN